MERLSQWARRATSWAIRHWAFVGLAILLAFGFFKLATTSRLVISPVDTETEYVITSQSNLQWKKITVKDKPVTVTVTKGRYEIVASQGDEHAFKIVDTKGFLKKTAVQLSTEPEKFREFVGDNPSECSFYHESVLYSYACGFSAIVTTHNPATTTSPTYTTKKDLAIGNILSSVTTKEGTVVFSRQPTTESGTKQPYTANLLGTGLAIHTTQNLDSLDGETNYKFIAYREGFLAYSLDLAKIYYYGSLGSQPTEIKISHPTDESYRALDISVRDQLIVTAYTNEVVNEGSDEEKPAKSKTPTIAAIIYDPSVDNSRNVAIKQQALQVELCGTNKLCVLGEKTNQPMKVYDVAGSSPLLEYGVSGVRSIVNNSVDTLLVTDSGIIALNTAERTGVTQYTFGSELKPCGVNGHGDWYIVCVYDKTNRYFALRLDSTRHNTDSIDKKIGQMRNNRDILGISAYGNLLYISAYFGEDTYSEADRAFVPNLENRKLVSKSIYNAMDKIGFSSDGYTISGILPRSSL